MNFTYTSTSAAFHVQLQTTSSVTTHLPMIKIEWSPSEYDGTKVCVFLLFVLETLILGWWLRWWRINRTYRILDQY